MISRASRNKFATLAAWVDALGRDRLLQQVLAVLFPPYAKPRLPWEYGATLDTVMDAVLGANRAFDPCEVEAALGPLISNVLVSAYHDKAFLDKVTEEYHLREAASKAALSKRKTSTGASGPSGAASSSASNAGSNASSATCGGGAIRRHKDGRAGHISGQAIPSSSSNARNSVAAAFPPQPNAAFPTQHNVAFPPQPANPFPPQTATPFPPPPATPFPPQPTTPFPHQPNAFCPPQMGAAFPPQPATLFLPQARTAAAPAVPAAPSPSTTIPAAIPTTFPATFPATTPATTPATAPATAPATVPAGAAAASVNGALTAARRETCIRAAPTERPSSNAATPPVWWGDDSERPPMWTPMDPSIPFECVPLDRNSAEFQVWRSVMNVFGLDITRVSRIQNPKLWKKYVRARDEMYDDKLGRLRQNTRADLPPYDLHESLLYHCSGEPDHKKICGKGLDLRLASSGYFGGGIYLTDDPQKAVTYSKNTGKLYVFAALLGDLLAVPARDDFASWKTEPEKVPEDQRSPTDKHFDSVVGRVASCSFYSGANEFVLYRHDATCPMYMVEFEGAGSGWRKEKPTAWCGVPDFAWRSLGARGADVPNPFGNVPGSSNYRDDGSRWNLFLNSFYQTILPYSNTAVCTRPTGENAGNAATPANTACLGRLVTEGILAKHPDLTCLICRDSLVQGETCLVMPCGHINGHIDCTDTKATHFPANFPLIRTRVLADGVTPRTYTRCMVCMQRFGVTVGTQPLSARMTHQVVAGITLAGHAPGTIEITYAVPSGRQDPDGEDPGKAFEGTYRKAYLPNSAEGHAVLALLQQAFLQRLIFTVGTSTTTGRGDVVTWAGIHHKTSASPNDAHGYPDASYLQNVREEMRQAGVIMP